MSKGKLKQSTYELRPYTPNVVSQHPMRADPKGEVACARPALPPGVSGPIAKGGGPAVRLRTEARFDDPFSTNKFKIVNTFVEQILVRLLQSQ